MCCYLRQIYGVVFLTMGAGARMNDREQVGLVEAVVYAIAMVAGGIGGAGAAALALLRGRPVTGVYVAAYVVLGAVGGAIAVGLDYWTLSALLGEHVAAVLAAGPILERATLAGFSVCATMVGINVGVARILRAAGIRIVMTRDDPDAPKRRSTDRQM